MPTYSGVRIVVGPLASAEDPYTSSNLFDTRDYYIADTNPAFLVPGIDDLFGDSTDDFTPGYVKSLTGVRSTSFLDDWYYRFHIVPRTVEFNNLLSTQNKLVYLWNSFFEDKELTDVSLPPVTGLVLTLPFSLPYTMNALEELNITVTAELVGPPTIVGELDITFDGEDFALPISGRRIAFFPFAPNWVNPVDETYQYNSWSIPGGNGNEQTGSTWGNRPRRNFEWEVLLREEASQRLDNLLFGWQQRFYGFPAWPEKSKLTDAALAGATVINCDTTNRSFRVGSLVVIYANDATSESNEILELTDSSITFTTPIVSAWAKGTTVYPLLVALIARNIAGVRLTDQHTRASISFDCEPSATETNTDPGTPALLYRGEELYIDKPNWASGLNFSFTSDRQDIDFGTGKVKAYSPSAYTLPARQHNWLLKNREQAQQFKAFLGRREGIARPVYMPSGNSDFKLVADIGNPSPTIDVYDNGYAAYVFPSPARRDIIILLRDGTHVARRIIGAIVVSPGVVRLQLDTDIEQIIPRASVKRVSYLNLYRFANNASTIRWVTDSVGTVEAQLFTKVTPD